MNDGPFPPELPDGFDGWPREAQVEWLLNRANQAQMVAMILDAAGAEVPDDAWPRADMATKRLLANALIGIRGEHA